MAINLQPYGSKFQTEQHDAGQDRYWSKRVTYDDLLFARGQNVQDWADLTQIAKGVAYNMLGETESMDDNPLFEYMIGAGVETIDKNFIRWRIYGEPERRSFSLGNLNDNPKIGLGGLPFTFWSEVDWWTSSDVLAPIKNKRVNIVIRSEDGTPFDGGYTYDAVLLSDNEADFIEASLLRTGDYWIKTGTVSSWEKLGTPGSIQFGEGFAYIEFEVPLNTSAWKFKVEGEAHRQWGNLSVTRTDELYRPLPMQGKISNYLELKAQKQIDKEKEMLLSWGTKTKHLLDPMNGSQITTSPGLFEYFEEGNVIGYSVESPNNLEFIMDQVEALWFDRVPLSKRRLLLYTGQGGLKIFSEWIASKFNVTPAMYSWDFVLQKRTPFDKTSGRGGYAFALPQYTEYFLPTFGSVTVAHLPLLDNTRVNGVIYPGTIYPVQSFEFLAMNIGFGEANTKLVKRTDNKINTYRPGFWSPFGATGEDNPVFKTAVLEEDAYEWVYRESYGVVVMNPKATLWFKPNMTY